ncbi:hypothetical protein GH714_011783 [Hevea brasiliensis]|uniref:CBS domain-containing protein n=1 Tax=Hevea brasiliensis TaxID=3981 RepID=A0A6A6N363_HEVBR|nr:hypothetical protein GH714_011783 [Hevea brasiliensis]
MPKRNRLCFSQRFSAPHRLAVSALSTVTNNGSARTGTYTVGDFMTRKEDLHVVKTSTTVDEALEALVEKKISGFPVVDDDWTLTFNEMQKLLTKNNGRIVGDLMTPAPLVVNETTNLEDAARLLLDTKYHRLPVVDGDGKLSYIEEEVINQIFCTKSLSAVHLFHQYSLDNAISLEILRPNALTKPRDLNYDAIR